MHNIIILNETLSIIVMYCSTESGVIVKTIIVQTRAHCCLIIYYGNCVNSYTVIT